MQPNNTCHICGDPACAWIGIDYQMRGVCQKHNPYDYAESHRRLVEVEAELAALRTWKAAAQPLLKVMADNLTFRDVNGPSLCLLCQLDNRPELTHATDCPVTLARALLAESEATDG